MLVSFLALAQLFTLVTARKCGESLQCICDGKSSWIVCEDLDCAPIFTSPVKKLRRLQITAMDPENFDYHSLTKTYGFKRVNLILKTVDHLHCHHVKILFRWINCYDHMVKTTSDCPGCITSFTNDRQSNASTSGIIPLTSRITAPTVFWICVAVAVFVIIVIMVIIIFLFVFIAVFLNY